jgi:DNA-binding LytR/AlgR family response regulator
MKIHAIIVDDEPLARERIHIMLRGEPDVEIVAECANGPEALAQIEQKNPELLFLDVQMPEMDGFEVLRNITAKKMPVVIFTTAYDQHAVRSRARCTASLKRALTNLEAKLPISKFFRVSRAAIVNLQRVTELQPMFQGESVVILKNGKAIPATRSLREIQEKLEMH